MDDAERKRRTAAVDAELAALRLEGRLHQARIRGCLQQLAHLAFDEKVEALERGGLDFRTALQRAARENPTLWQQANPVHRN